MNPSDYISIESHHIADLAPRFALTFFFVIMLTYIL